MGERWADDHANAKTLAEGLSQMEGIAIDPSTVETNLVFFMLEQPDLTPVQLAQRLRSQGVLLNAGAGRRMRAVLNHHVTEADVPVVLDAFERAMRADVAADSEKVVIYG
jgi:threonine aldolase